MPFHSSQHAQTNLSRLSRINSSMLLKPNRLLSSEEDTLSPKEYPTDPPNHGSVSSLKAHCILLHRPGLATMEDDTSDTGSVEPSSLKYTGNFITYDHKVLSKIYYSLT